MKPRKLFLCLIPMLLLAMGWYCLPEWRASTLDLPCARPAFRRHFRLGPNAVSGTGFGITLGANCASYHLGFGRHIWIRRELSNFGAPDAQWLVTDVDVYYSFGDKYYLRKR